jgi:hypothetical protein
MRWTLANEEMESFSPQTLEQARRIKKFYER